MCQNPPNFTQKHTFRYKMNSTSTSRHTHTATLYLLPPLFLAFVLGGLQHLLLPQVEEVRGVGVKLQCVLLVVPARTNREIGGEKKLFIFFGLIGRREVGGDLDWGQDGKKMEQDVRKYQIQQNVDANLFNS